MSVLTIKNKYMQQQTSIFRKIIHSQIKLLSKHMIKILFKFKYFERKEGPIVSKIIFLIIP